MQVFATKYNLLIVIKQVLGSSIIQDSHGDAKSMLGLPWTLYAGSNLDPLC